MCARLPRMTTAKPCLSNSEISFRGSAPAVATCVSNAFRVFVVDEAAELLRNRANSRLNWRFMKALESLPINDRTELKSPSRVR